MHRLVLLALLAASASGCMSAELARVRSDLARDLPHARIARGHAPSLGRLSIGLARTFAGDDDPTTRAALGHVRGVAFGRYAVEASTGGFETTAPRALARAAARGWEPVVTVRDRDEAVWVLARTDPRGDVSGLMVWMLARDELVLTKVTGSLSDLVAALGASGSLGLPDAARDALGQAVGARAPAQYDSTRSMAPSSRALAE